MREHEGAANLHDNAQLEVHTIADTSEACQSRRDSLKNKNVQLFLEYEDEPKLAVASHSRESS